MELILHAGTHKTATTTFQAICAAQRDRMAADGLCFPAYKTWNQHSFAAWDLQARDDRAVGQFLGACHAQAERSGCRTVLLSGEDFENCLVDTNLARAFQDMAREVGFTRVRWIFVQRDPFDYMTSIYAEKSRYGVVVNMEALCKVALRCGFFSLATGNYNYKFVFDVERFARIFRAEVGANIAVIPFAEFKADFVGKVLLSQHLGAEVIEEIRVCARTLGTTNARLSEEMVERLYACNFLRTKPKSDYARSRSKLMQHLIDARLSVRRETEGKMRAAFSERFG